MMKKQLLSAVTLACLMTVQAFPAYGAVMESAAVAEAADSAQVPAEGLSAATLRAKSILAIDSTIWDDFTYDSYDSGDGQRWSLSWRQSADEEQRLSATIDDQGIIRSYSYYRPLNVSGLAAVRQAQAQQSADAFLAQVASGYVDSLHRLPEEVVSQSGDGFTFMYQQQHEGLPVADGTVTIEVNRYTGSVTSFYVNESVNCGQLDWPSSGKAISAAAAEKALLNELGVELVYLGRYDYRTEAYSVYPAYRLAQSNQVIDALTGKAVTLSDNPTAILSKTSANEAAMDSGVAGGAGLSPKELAAVEANSQLVSQESAVSTLRRATGADYAVKTASLSATPYEKSRYIWRISLQTADGRQSVSGTVDAQTGQLLGFYCYDDREKLAEPQSEAQAQQAVTAFLKQYAPAELAASEAVVQADQADADAYYTYQYQRLVNGVAFPDNGLSISYDGTTGRISSYQLNWNKSVTFPSVQEAKQPAAIVKDMIKEAQFTLAYAREASGYRLIYDFADKSAMRFDPFSGARLNWQGQAYVPQVRTSYHWQGAANENAQRLYENGIYLDKSTLNAQSPITQGEFAQLLYRSRYPYAEVTDREAIYKELNSLGLILQKEAAPSAAVTREQAALYAVRLLGYDRLSTLSDLFRYPYSDQANDAYQASVAMAGALGLLTADSTGHIRPADTLTLGEAFDMLYRALGQ